MRKHLPRRLIVASLLLAACTHAAAYEITGKVIKVAEGDIITIMENNHNKQRIRLADIDAPEKKQPFDQQSREYLKTLVGGKEVTANCRKKDYFKRDICTVLIDGLDVNAKMIRTGHAWVFNKYKRRDDLPTLQEEVKANKSGLWALPVADIVPPNQWRKINNQ